MNKTNLIVFQNIILKFSKQKYLYPLYLFICFVSLWVSKNYGDKPEIGTGDIRMLLNYTNAFLTGDFFFLTPNKTIGYSLFALIPQLISKDNYWLLVFWQIGFYLTALSFFIHNADKFNLWNVNQKIFFLIFSLFTPTMVYANIILGVGTVTASLFLITISFLLQLLYGKNNVWHFFLFGLFTGWLILTNSIFIIGLPFFVFVFGFNMKKIFLNFSKILIIYLPIFIILSLNTYKNWVQYNRFILLSTGAGTVIYGGNNLNGDASWHTKWVDGNNRYIPEKEMSALLKSDAYEQDSIFKKLAKQAWKTDPNLQLKMIWTKFLKLWAVPANVDVWSLNLDFKNNGAFDPFLKQKYSFSGAIWFFGIYFVHLLTIIFGAAGLFLIFFKNKFSIVNIVFISIFFIYTFVFIIPIYGLPRFQYPVLPLLNWFISIFLGSYKLQVSCSMLTQNK